MTTSPDPRARARYTVPFHLRSSNKDVEAAHVVPGGARHSMLVDWVTVHVMRPTGDS